MSIELESRPLPQETVTGLPAPGGFPYFAYADRFPFQAAATEYSPINAWWLADASFLVRRDLVTGAESLTAGVKAMAGEVRLHAGQLPFPVAGLADHCAGLLRNTAPEGITRLKVTRFAARIRKN